jgi:hypothetical protein
MIYILVLIWKLPNIPTIQKKPYNRSFPVPMANFVDALRPEKFSGVHSKRWSVKITDWFTAMEVSGSKMAYSRETSLINSRVNSRKPMISLWELCVSAFESYI